MTSLLRLGSKGPAVAEIRHKLTLLGLLADAPAASAAAQGRIADLEAAEFDAPVDAAVRAFQQQRGVTVDGIVGPQTYRALDEARWRLGDRILTHAVSHLLAGDDVVTLQQRLLELGFDCGRVDGIFGRRTESALREFQRNVGLVSDGTCGPKTFKALDRLSRSSALKVLGPQVPSGTRPTLRWNSRRADSVRLPKMPSTRPQSKPISSRRRCRAATSSPVSWRLTV